MDGIKFGILTVSDRCFAREAEDVSGPELVKAVETSTFFANAHVTQKHVVPDEKHIIQEQLRKWCNEGLHVILTTGGTGVAPRDVTPEAVAPLLDTRVNGLACLILMEGLKKTPFAALSRTIVGIRKKTLVICLPGSSKGALEGFEAVAPVLQHAVQLVLDEKDAVSATHREDVLKSKVSLNTSEMTRLRESKYRMVAMSAVEGIFEKKIARLGVSNELTEDALGCILGETIISPEDYPQYPTSMKDGYAVHSLAKKKYLLVGESKPGSKYAEIVGDDEAVKVSTGSAVPQGTNFVVPVEVTSYDEECRELEIAEDYYYYCNRRCTEIRGTGSDMSRGDVLVREGTLLAESEISLLASIGKASVAVVRKPVIALLSTGDEIQDPWVALKPYGVRDSNKVGLKCLLRSWGYQIVDLGIARDEPDIVLKAIHAGFKCADVIITTGGMSMGERDLIKDVLIHDFDAKIHFGRLAMKPGKPTGFGTVLFNGTLKYWFGLPGNPASAFVTSHVVVLPALRLMSGWTSNVQLNKITASLGEDIMPDTERLEYQRGVLTFVANGEVLPRPTVVSTGQTHHEQRSSNIRGCSRANCFLEIPPGEQMLLQGSEVTVVIIKV